MVIQRFRWFGYVVRREAERPLSEIMLMDADQWEDIDDVDLAKLKTDAVMAVGR